MIRASLSILLSSVLLAAQQGSGQDDQILEKGNKLLEEAKAAYEEARSKSSVAAYVDAGFKLEEARIKFIVLQEIGSPEKQKLATDRMRAINQLGKLIHDGKVAISGNPAEAGSKPADKPAAPPPKDPAAEPDNSAKPVIDVMKRLPVPEESKQREAEKLVKELFKEEYSKTSPTDKKALARHLLGQGRKSKDDPAGVWVLLREALNASIHAGDSDLALESVDAAANLFDVDALAMKTTALTGITKTAKTPEELTALVHGVLNLADELIPADQFDTADRLLSAAVQHAKKGSDAPLSARVATRSKEVAEAKTLYQAQKGVLQTLARNPEDPGGNLEMGKFLCYVKGSWDLGLRFLVKGSDPALKALAEKELSMVLQAAERTALADGWYELAEKEKSPLRKSQLSAHARTIYESALPEATALLRAKIEKRLETLGQTAPAAGPVDLLRLIDVNRDSVAGEWALNSRALLCNQKARFARIQIPYEPPDEYDVSLVVERKDGFEVYLGLSRGPSQFYLAIDDWGGTLTAIGWIDGKHTRENENLFRGRVLTNDKPSTVLCSVRKEGVSVTIDGKKITSFKGSFNRLSNSDVLGMPNPRAMFLGCNDGRCTFSRATLTPVSGQGKPAR